MRMESGLAARESGSNVDVCGESEAKRPLHESFQESRTQPSGKKHGHGSRGLLCEGTGCERRIEVEAWPRGSDTCRV